MQNTRNNLIPKYENTASLQKYIEFFWFPGPYILRGVEALLNVLIQLCAELFPALIRNGHHHNRNAGSNVLWSRPEPAAMPKKKTTTRQQQDNMSWKYESERILFLGGFPCTHIHIHAHTHSRIHTHGIYERPIVSVFQDSNKMVVLWPTIKYMAIPMPMSPCQPPKRSIQ